MHEQLHCSISGFTPLNWEITAPWDWCREKYDFKNLFAAITLMASLDGCHQRLTDPSLYLLSPNYPRSMELPRGLECIYTITLPLGRRIMLYWEYFNLGYGCAPARIEVGYYCIKGENIGVYSERWALRPIVWLKCCCLMHGYDT